MILTHRQILIYICTHLVIYREPLKQQQSIVRQQLCCCHNHITRSRPIRASKRFKTTYKSIKCFYTCEIVKWSFTALQRGTYSRRLCCRALATTTFRKCGNSRSTNGTTKMVQQLPISNHYMASNIILIIQHISFVCVCVFVCALCTACNYTSFYDLLCAAHILTASATDVFCCCLQLTSMLSVCFCMCVCILNSQYPPAQRYRFSIFYTLYSIWEF